jgi:hypothetical protein
VNGVKGRMSQESSIGLRKEDHEARLTGMAYKSRSSLYVGTSTFITNPFFDESFALLAPGKPGALSASG